MTTVAGSVAVEPVRGKDELRAFLRLPWRIYGRDSKWVPPLLSEVEETLDPDRHPFHKHGEIQTFLARRDGEPVGRIAAILNRAHLDQHHDGVGFFGFFECVDDLEVAGALFDAAAGWLRDRGLTAMRGPASPSVNDEAGLLLDAFDGRPMFLMPYNPPYYRDLFERNGVVLVRELEAFLVNMRRMRETGHFRGDEDERAAKIKKRYHVTIRKVLIKNAEKEAPIIESLFNRAWEDNWGFVPMSREEALYMTGKMKQIADEDLVLIGSIDGEPVGFALALPDFNEVLARLNGKLGPVEIAKVLYYRRKIRGVRLLALGVLEEHRRKGIDSLIMYELITNALKAGYDDMEISWILEDNKLAMRRMTNLDLPRYRTYGMFERPIPPA